MNIIQKCVSVKAHLKWTEAKWITVLWSEKRKHGQTAEPSNKGVQDHKGPWCSQHWLHVFGGVHLWCHKRRWWCLVFRTVWIGTRPLPAATTFMSYFASTAYGGTWVCRGWDMRRTHLPKLPGGLWYIKRKLLEDVRTHGFINQIIFGTCHFQLFGLRKLLANVLCTVL